MGKNLRLFFWLQLFIFYWYPCQQRHKFSCWKCCNKYTKKETRKESKMKCTLKAEIVVRAGRKDEEKIFRRAELETEQSENGQNLNRKTVYQKPKRKKGVLKRKPNRIREKMNLNITFEQSISKWLCAYLVAHLTVTRLRQFECLSLSL